MGMGHEKMKKQWTDYKAMESCFGTDMPELDLPMYKNPGRVVHALLSSAQNLEQMKMLKAFQHLSQSTQTSNNQPQGIQLVLGQQQQPQENMFKKIMMKSMMQKLFFNNDHEEPAAQTYRDEYQMDFTSPFGNIKKQGNKYEMMEQMMKTFMNHKNKRAADDVFELGD